MRGKKRWTLHRLHQWAGLLAGIWLAVLGTSGLLLDHRQDWRWLWQSKVADFWLPDDVVAKARTGIWRIYQIHPHNDQQQVAGGPLGLWWTRDGGKFWKQTRFVDSLSPPAVKAVDISSDASGLSLWLATDEGLWLSHDFGQTAHVVALPGKRITALSHGHSPSLVLGVEQYSRVFQFDNADHSIRWLDLSSIDQGSLPDTIDLSRWVHDLHFGRGFLLAPLDLWINDFTGAALLLLPLSGFLFWYLPKRWRAQKPGGPAPNTKKITMQTLLRTHSSITGIFLSVPIIYLAMTGIVLDHGKELRQWMKSTAIDRSFQTPVYTMRSWAGEIYAITAYPEDPQRISIGTRLGLFTSYNLGESWRRDTAVTGFVWTLKRIDNTLFLGAMGAPNRVLQDQTWHIAKGSGHMPTDITQDEAGDWYWLNGKGVMRGGLAKPYAKADGRFPVRFPVRFPEVKGVPWYYALDALHSGMIFTPHWKWVNDVFALLALFLVITGLTRWWRTKWV